MIAVELGCSQRIKRHSTEGAVMTWQCLQGGKSLENASEIFSLGGNITSNNINEFKYTLLQMPGPHACSKLRIRNQQSQCRKHTVLTFANMYFEYKNIGGCLLQCEIQREDLYMHTYLCMHTYVYMHRCTHVHVNVLYILVTKTIASTVKISRYQYFLNAGLPE